MFLPLASEMSYSSKVLAGKEETDRQTGPLTLSKAWLGHGLTLTFSSPLLRHPLRVLGTQGETYGAPGLDALPG